ncbi:MAG TPA: DUF2269 family protein [Candidatus Limnocylindria bacterium]|nr:DUF2269 family protein [Candidatus Limnocylindria bacterium]
MHEWIVYAHVLGAFVFILAHGVSMFTSFRLRGTRDPARVAELLELSGRSIGLLYIGLLVLLAAGVAAGFSGGFWGRGWIWAAIGLLVVILAVMYSVAAPFYGRMRAAAGIPGYVEKANDFKPPATPEDLQKLARSSRPIWLAAVGGIGLAAIIYLMVVKPF